VTREPRRFTVFGFASVHDTLAAEDALRIAGVPAVTVPSPRELGELCGIAIRVVPDRAAEAADALETAGAPPRASAEVVDF
jgi:ribosomal protein L7Ae-like RNA K-turn-binding protein